MTFVASFIFFFNLCFCTEVFSLVTLCNNLLMTCAEATASRSSSFSPSGSLTLPHPLFSSSPPAALHPSAEHRYLFRNLSVEIILHLRRSLSTHNYHGQSCRTVLNSAGTPTLMALLRPGGMAVACSGGSLLHTSAEPLFLSPVSVSF